MTNLAIHCSEEKGSVFIYCPTAERRDNPNRVYAELSHDVLINNPETVYEMCWEGAYDNLTTLPEDSEFVCFLTEHGLVSIEEGDNTLDRNN